MQHKLTSLESELTTVFGLEVKQGFGEASKWFSYGSNMNPWYFEGKMRERGSPLILEAVTKGSLSEFSRALDNRSKGHGLAYEIHGGSGPVQGIIHEVPSTQLPFFLRMEGVLDENFGVGEHPSYDVIEVEVHKNLTGAGPTAAAFSLQGSKICSGSERENRARENSTKVDEYVRAALSGAKTQGVDPSPFVDDLNWLRGLRQVS